MKNTHAISPHGQLHVARQCPSLNRNERPDNTLINLLVIHNISLPPAEFKGHWIDDFFTNQLDPSAHPYFATIAQLKVSSHLLIRRDGEIVQYVPFLKRAWHAGISEFDGVTACNDFSIGIELEGTDDMPFTEAQYQALIQTTQQIMQTYPEITPERIIGHSDIAPERKTDPGAYFDWVRFKTAL